jgi:Zn-dependent protease
MWQRSIHMVTLLPAVILALVIHEYAHGLAADRLGDPTPRAAGRLTINPFRHLDVLGTLMLLLVHFGWARPVPFNSANFRHPRSGTIWVSLSGPAANIIGALGCGLLLRLLAPLVPVSSGQPSPTIFLMLAWGMAINLVLAVFNLLPVPPLDGSKVLMGLLPAVMARFYRRWEHLGPFFILFVVFGARSFLWGVITPWVVFFSRLFAGDAGAQILTILSGTRG